MFGSVNFLTATATMFWKTENDTFK